MQIYTYIYLSIYLYCIWIWIYGYIDNGSRHRCGWCRHGPRTRTCTAGPRALGSPLGTGRILDQSPDFLVKSAEIPWNPDVPGDFWWFVLDNFGKCTVNQVKSLFVDVSGILFWVIWSHIHPDIDVQQWVGYLKGTLSSGVSPLKSWCSKMFKN